LDAAQKAFFEYLASLPEVVKPSSRVAIHNSTNKQLRKRERGLRYLLEQFTQESEQYDAEERQLRQIQSSKDSSNVTATSAPRSEAATTRKEDSLSDQADTSQRAIETLILQVDAVKPALRTMEEIANVAESSTAKRIVNIHQVAFKHLKKDTKELFKSAGGEAKDSVVDPKKLIRNVLSSSIQLEA